MAEHRALILDFGGVISKTLFETHTLTERALGLPPGALAWRGPFDPDSDPLWVDMQLGKLSERDYWLARAREVGALVGETWTTMAELVTRARGADPAAVIRPEALDAIKAAKAAGAKLAVLSNELDLFYGADFRAKLPFLSRFDAICDATYTGVLKPAARAYLDCCAELGLPPGCCVFVDDQPKNVAGAKAVGMRSIRFDVRHPGDSFREAVAALTLSPARTSHA
jgi:putative hydrolase of the HAD superfamily